MLLGLPLRFFQKAVLLTMRQWRLLWASVCRQRGVVGDHEKSCRWQMLRPELPLALKHWKLRCSGNLSIFVRLPDLVQKLRLLVWP